jgi:hypothetical protein
LGCGTDGQVQSKMPSSRRFAAFTTCKPSFIRTCSTATGLLFKLTSYLFKVYLDRHGMVAFHKKVLNSQFCWWSLVPVLGCATASVRWKAMQESKRKYGIWAHCSHMALTKSSVIVVGMPAEDALSKDLPAQVSTSSTRTAPCRLRNH